MWPFARRKSWRKISQAQLSKISDCLELNNEALIQLHRMVGSLAESLNKLTDELRTRQDGICDRLEFVRREIMFEMRHGDSEGYRDTPTITWRVISADKVRVGLDEGLRLNLGCGHLTLPDFINVDARELPGVDIIGDVTNLQLPDDSVLEMYAAHLLEHFPQEQMQRTILPHWKKLLRRDATLRVVVPDAEAMLSALMHDKMSYEDFREVTFGAQDYAGDFHFNMFTPASLTKLLSDGGFSEVNVLQRARRNGKCFELELTARA
jgi:hypothetical protein